MPRIPTGPPLAALRAPAEILERVRRDVERNALRARNGIKLAAGVGRPMLGQTPRELIWAAGHAQLWRYRNDRISLRPPLLLVFSLMSKSYVLDLQPGNSFVEQLQAAGLDVFLLDWLPADERHAGERLEDYADYYVPEAVRRVIRASDSDSVNLFGYCLGGVLTLLFAAHHVDAPLRSLSVMATPVDFSRFELGRELAREGRLSIDDLLDDNGNIPASIVRQLFRLLKPTADVRQYVSLLENVWNDEYMSAYQAMTTWSEDHVPFPGAAARQIFEMLVRGNGFMCDSIRLDGETIRLHEIEIPMLTVIAERDHIVPAAVAAPLLELVGSKDHQLLQLDAGHVGLIVGRTAAKVTIPRIIEFLKARSEPLEAAQ